MERSAVPTQEEFVLELIRLAGGPESLAKFVWNEANRPSAAPMLKAKLVDIMLGGMKAVAKSSAGADMAEMSDAELEALIDARLARIAARAKEPDPNGPDQPQQSPEAAPGAAAPGDPADPPADG